MENGILEIVDYLLAQIKRSAELGPEASAKSGGQGSVGSPKGLDIQGLQSDATDIGLSPETVVELVSQEMMSEDELRQYFPEPGLDRPNIACHHLLALARPGARSLALSVYYDPDGALNIGRSRYVLDSDVWVEKSGRFWSFISIVAVNIDEARQFLEAFISRLGFSSGFKATREGRRIVVSRLNYH